MCKLCADPDVHVKNGTKLLDRLVKDIVAEIEHFDTEKFIPILQDRIGMTNTFVRQFLLGWISVLNSVPNIDLVNYLPHFLDGLFNMLRYVYRRRKIDRHTVRWVDRWMDEWRIAREIDREIDR
tara:strand:- start:161 stop:532 length:372 start_codon:yes stop_codon:yes gene_type:complete